MAYFTLMHVLYKTKKKYKIWLPQSLLWNILMYILLKRLKTSLHRHFSFLHKSKLRQDLKEKKPQQNNNKKSFLCAQKTRTVEISNFSVLGTACFLFLFFN